MTVVALPLSPPNTGILRAVLLGGLAVGVLDGLDALIFFGARGAEPIHIFQAVAGGLLGREAARAGGLATFALGLLLHFCIATTVAAVYCLASRRWPLLVERAVACGLAYGVLVFFFMQHVVIPLSALGGGPARPFSLAVLANGVLGHALLVGLPSALCARLARRE